MLASLLRAAAGHMPMVRALELSRNVALVLQDGEEAAEPTIREMVEHRVRHFGLQTDVDACVADMAAAVEARAA